MKLHVIGDRQELYNCRQQWNRVAGERAFFTWEWNVHWFREMTDAKAKPWVIVGLDESGQWESIAPFYVDGRKLRLLGSGTACTDYTNLFSRGANLRPFADRVVDYLRTNVGAAGQLQQINWVEMEGGGRQDSELSYFSDQLAAEGFSYHETETEGTWKLALPESVDGLNAILNSQCRRKVRKAGKRLASQDVEIVFAEASNFDRVWSDFVALHQARRQQLDQAGCFADVKFEAFLKQATLGLLDRELSALFVIYKANQPVATQLLLRDNDQCMMYQSGAAPKFFSEEPGFQAIVTALEYAIDRRAKVYDFLRGDEGYKSKWSTTREAIVYRRFVPGKLSSQLMYRSWLVSRRFKRLVASFL